MLLPSRLFHPSLTASLLKLALSNCAKIEALSTMSTLEIDANWLLPMIATVNFVAFVLLAGWSQVYLRHCVIFSDCFLLPSVDLRQCLARGFYHVCLSVSFSVPCIILFEGASLITRRGRFTGQNWQQSACLDPPLSLP